MEKIINIAIDGPAGAGKSSISKEVAKKLGIVYVDTGAMYRACGLYAIENAIKICDEEITPVLDKINIDILYNNGVQEIYLNGKNVSERIRHEDVTMASSYIATIVSVRLKLVELQRNIAKTKSVIMDGRDIGTYVLPDADLKIFLTASVEQRAKRRYLEMLQKGMTSDIGKVIADIEERDKNDSTREFSPLKQAEDAILLDTSLMEFDEACDAVISLINQIKTNDNEVE